MSRFLYRLTQEIVTSRNFSDANINRICRKHYRNSSYPDKERLAKTINDLKHKLEVQHSDLKYGSSETPSVEERRCSCSKKSKRPSKNTIEELLQDKGISVQSFNKLPGLLVNHAEQFGEAHNDQLSRLAAQQFSDPLKKCRDKTSSTDSISTITTYDFSSPHSTTPNVHRRKSLEDTETLIGQILSSPDNNGVEDLMDNCCGRTKNSTDSSADMVLRMAASDRVFQGKNDPKCPLHRCEEFGQSSVACGAAGGCGSGCGSDFPLPKPAKVEAESPQATCCGRRKSRKAGSKKNDAAGKRKNGKKSKGDQQNRCGTK
ncbi:AAEL009697-PA [Aedes aegypti]|uniref:AAEL009697-PA n=1 Tax=Aedes aegypti TaxID=7159 RepID=Q16V25_AEDAE|nr:AAEL009697-PA [Aedes aegypti]